MRSRHTHHPTDSLYRLPGFSSASLSKLLSFFSFRFPPFVNALYDCSPFNVCFPYSRLCSTYYPYISLTLTWTCVVIFLFLCLLCILPISFAFAVRLLILLFCFYLRRGLCISIFAPGFSHRCTILCIVCNFGELGNRLVILRCERRVATLVPQCQLYVITNVSKFELLRHPCVTDTWDRNIQSETPLTRSLVTSRAYCMICMLSNLKQHISAKDH